MRQQGYIAQCSGGDGKGAGWKLTGERRLQRIVRNISYSTPAQISLSSVLHQFYFLLLEMRKWNTKVIPNFPPPQKKKKT